MSNEKLKCFINFEDLKTLARVASDQMMFPSFRSANPVMTQKIERALYNAEKAEKERIERCLEHSKPLLQEIARRQAEINAELERLGQMS